MLLVGQRAIDQLVVSLFSDIDCTACDDVYHNLRIEDGIRFCCNRPKALSIFAWLVGAPFPGEFNIKATLVSLFSDPQVCQVTVALAYIDRQGAGVLHRALDRY